MAVLIDTSVLMAVERGHRLLSDLLTAEESYVMSVVSAAELLHGVHRGAGHVAAGRAAFVEGLLARFAPLPIDLLVARAYARASAELAQLGQSVDANDLWIAATGLAHGLRVLALDGDFRRIPGVQLVPLGS